MTADRCSCADLAVTQDARLAQWRDVCTKFYYHHDAIAQRVLDHFENTTVDQIVIETLSPSSSNATSSSHDETTFRELLALLAISTCALPGHQESYNDAIMAMERVKNDVRGGYHRHVARQNYDAFDQSVRQSGQGINYISSGEQLTSRFHEIGGGYVRSTIAQTDQHQRVSDFVASHRTNIGGHPFLAGLRHVLEWNLSCTSVVAWKLSDAVFVESGIKFGDAALHLLIHELHFGHVEAPQPSVASATTNTMRHRLWYLDPYMSDNDIKQLLKLLPPLSRLESRGTGEQLKTEIQRANAHGIFDEVQPFFQKWCVIL